MTNFEPHATQMVAAENALRESSDASGPPPPRRPEEPAEAFFLDMRPGRSSTVQLPLGAGNGTARFDAVVVDAPKATAASAVQDCSVFIVPQVRHHNATDGSLVTVRAPVQGVHCVSARLQTQCGPTRGSCKSSALIDLQSRTLT